MLRTDLHPGSMSGSVQTQQMGAQARSKQCHWLKLRMFDFIIAVFVPWLS